MKEVIFEERVLMVVIFMDVERFSFVIDFGVDFDEDKSGGDFFSVKVGEKVGRYIVVGRCLINCCDYVVMCFYFFCSGSKIFCSWIVSMIV